MWKAFALSHNPVDIFDHGGRAYYFCVPVTTFHDIKANQQPPGSGPIDPLKGDDESEEDIRGNDGGRR
jgi:hypothetical protein